jgi:hypothetical protein
VTLHGFDEIVIHFFKLFTMRECMVVRDTMNLSSSHGECIGIHDGVVGTELPPLCRIHDKGERHDATLVKHMCIIWCSSLAGHGESRGFRVPCEVAHYLLLSGVFKTYTVSTYIYIGCAFYFLDFLLWAVVMLLPCCMTLVAARLVP